MEEGSRLHKEYQLFLTEKFNNIDILFKKEVKVKEDIEYKNINYTINGRIDSLIIEDKKIIIEEIKSVGKITDDLSLEYNKAYLAQLLMYAYFISKNIEEDITIEVKMTYISRSDESKKSFSKEISKNELLSFFMEALECLYKFNKLSIDNNEQMVISGKAIKFPYETYRLSQRKLMSAVYNCITNKNKLFAQAPTGVGKTLSTLFPSIKALSNKLGKKIFYITAKTVTKTVCLENLLMLKESGFLGISLDINSKENICVNDKINCNPTSCDRAKGHFDRLNEAIYDIISNEKIITPDVVKEYSYKHNICPYFFQTELIDFVHIVVCDYNYVFNPSVSLNKYFDKEKNDFIILVDEAHNLEDRSRDFFSASLKKSELMFLEKNIDNKHIKNLCKTIKQNLNNFFDTKENYSQSEMPKQFINTLYDLRFLLDDYFAINEIDVEIKEKMLESYFAIDYFLKTSLYFDEKYRVLYEYEYRDNVITLFCIDTSTRFFKINTLCRCVVFFSATLTPINYFADIYGGDKEDFFISLDTSFDINNQLTLINSSISTYYNSREQSYPKIANAINTFVNCKKGNYFVFFPSYDFLEKVLEYFKKLNNTFNIVVQKSNMNVVEKDSFLNTFNDENKNSIGFLVSGGTFSEGVNLVGNKLIGAVVVGVGISKINFKSDTVKNHFDNYNNMGYEFAYMYQGFNKILQSAGRVIRSETDRGVILFIDNRYVKNEYKVLFPNNYQNAITVNNDKDLEKELKNFW